MCVSSAYRKKIADHMEGVVHDRCIENVLHFTRLSNLRSILQYGILSRFDLLHTDKLLNVTSSDFDRLDENERAVSVSVSCYYPKMFDAKRHRSGSKSWAVLGLSPRLLWELDCHFYAHSAVSNETKYERGVGKRNNGYAFETLFQNRRISPDEMAPWYREAADLPHSFPTHPDSEVQVLEPIPPSYIQAVWVGTTQDEAKLKEVLELLGREEIGVWVSPFKPRHEYQNVRWG